MSLTQFRGDVAHTLQAQEVVVLAPNFVLSGPQRKLLSRGLFFIPVLGVPRGQEEKLQWDIQNYHRKIKLAVYFKDSDYTDKPPFTAPSEWTPFLDELPPEVGILIREDLRVLKQHFITKKEKYNISLEEARALQELRQTKHIVIKPADKGSAVVILSREQYVFEVQRQLQDAEYYHKLDKPMYPETIPMVKTIVESLKRKKFINGKQKKYLIGDSQPRERRFYILPKIHKDPDKWTVPFQIPPGRPIVSDCNSETYFTAEYIDFYLNPLSVKHPAYIKDTYHFLDLVHNLRLPSDFYFFSMDVDALYTNIPILEGIACVRRIFEKYPDPGRPDEELLKLLEINLTRNDFVFDGEFYLQIKGTAMGKRFAPAYANIFMANWEEEVLAKCEKSPAYYVRYLDDIWGIWMGSEAEFDKFMDTLNSHNPSIKLKSVLNRETIDFLDTTIYKGPDFDTTHKLDVKVFFKTTDTHALLHKDSFHPKHTFRGIVKSQLLRFQRICTREEEFWKAVKTLFKALRERGYGRSFLRFCLKTFQEGKDKVRGDLIPLITTYSFNNKPVIKAVKDNFESILGHTDLVRNSAVISAYRRNKNLSDFLIRAKLPSLQREKPQKLEAQFVRLKFAKSGRDNKIVAINQQFNTRTRNCVYLIFCSTCGQQYVGETKNDLSTRMYQHRYNIENKKKVDTLLVTHFLAHGLAALRMAGLECNEFWTDQERRAKEKFWIFRLGTRDPFGLNIKRN